MTLLWDNPSSVPILENLNPPTWEKADSPISCSRTHSKWRRVYLIAIRQSDGEYGTFIVLHLYLTSMCRNILFHDSQPQTGAIALIPGDEWIEKGPDDLRRDTLPVVPDDQHYLIIAGRCRNIYPRLGYLAAQQRLRGIAHQVHDTPDQLALIAGNRLLTADTLSDDHRPMVDLSFRPLDPFFHQCPEGVG